jgi:hypothetical protein
MRMNFCMAKITLDRPELWGSTPGKVSPWFSDYDSGELRNTAGVNGCYDSVPIELQTTTTFCHSSRELKIGI